MRLIDADKIVKQIIAQATTFRVNLNGAGKEMRNELDMF